MITKPQPINNLRLISKTQQSALKWMGNRWIESLTTNWEEEPWTWELYSYDFY